MKSISITQRITATTMAFLMFFTSVGFTVDMHYCQGELKTFSFFGKAKSCHDMGQGMKDCPFHTKAKKAKNAADSSIHKKGCCSNKILHFQSDQDKQYPGNNGVNVNSQMQNFVFSFVERFIKSSVLEADKISLAHYETPLIPRDIYVLLETYRL